jgi:hypothetical protein
MTWLFCFQVTRPLDGKRVENCKPVGLVADFPDEKAAWVEVGRLGLEKHFDNVVGPEPTFREIAEHWRLHELRKEGIIGKKAEETADRDEHNLDEHVLPRWGGLVASAIKPTEVEAWFEGLAAIPLGARKKPLKWPTIDKINSVMSQVYAHAQRQGLIPAEMNCNPFRPPKFGGVRCKRHVGVRREGCQPSTDGGHSSQTRQTRDQVRVDIGSGSRSNGPSSRRVFCVEVVRHRLHQQPNFGAKSLEQRKGDGRKDQWFDEARANASRPCRLFE